MNIKKFLYNVLVIIMFAYAGSIKADTWKFFFYMDASDSLCDMALKNITDMMRSNLNDNVDVVIQLHAYEQVALRYRITTNGLVFVEEVALSTDCKKDFIDAAAWAFTCNSTDHTLLVFSNHGWGAIDPRWNSVSSQWEAAGMTLSNNGDDSCLVPNKDVSIDIAKLHSKFKGFMFNAPACVYLTNKDLSDGLAYITENLLHNKIDIVAFDTCMGSMLEVAMCIAPYARYLVGVQSCAMRDGFDYQGCMSVLCHGNNPRQTAEQFVAVFDDYYKKYDEDGIYTCAALDLSYIDIVNERLNTLVTQIMKQPELMPLLEQAREKTPRFCLWPIYSDLVAFWQLVETQLQALPTTPESNALINSIKELYSAVATLVVARCGGESTLGQAHGFSIYLPPGKMELSYLDSLFARYSRWPNLIGMLT